jgi:sec-independent protein translocase protein TatB
MFNVGAGEMVFILVAALLVLGPSRLPEMARAVGKFMREFRRQTDDVRVLVEREFYKMDEEELRAPPAQPPAPLSSPDVARAAAVPAPPPVVLTPAAHVVARGEATEEAGAAHAPPPAGPTPQGEG